MPFFSVSFLQTFAGGVSYAGTTLTTPELAASNGISYGTFLKRVNRYRWDYTTAATTPVSRLNGIRRFKEIYGEDYFRNLMNWVFAPGRIKKGVKKDGGR